LIGKASMNRNQVGTLLKSLWKKRVPGQLVIQLTDRCNALCTQCGMRATEAFPRSKLSMDDVKRILDAAAARGVRVVSFTGGEPFLFFKDLVHLIRYAGQAGIDYVRTGTNGFVFIEERHPSFESRIKRMAESLAETPLRNFWVSIDSAVPEIHEKMRGFPGLIKGIEKALPIFHQSGLYPSANLGINRNMGGKPGGNTTEETDFHTGDGRLCREFIQAFRRFYGFVIDLGFTIVNVCYPMSVDTHETASGLQPVYGATSKDPLVTFSGNEKAAIFKALIDTVPEFRSRIRVFSPRSSLYALYRRYQTGKESPYPCLGGKDFFFIDARDGNTYPCGYRGHENYGKLWDPQFGPPENPTPCRRCDWECFRDPSELFGPLLQARSDPLSLAAEIRRDPLFYRLWNDDLLYYRACDLFDGRKAPNVRKLRCFGTSDCEIPLTPAWVSPPSAGGERKLEGA
jgi:MoaA/NifB/PqqE/SkfB family radical SAM enzyme